MLCCSFIDQQNVSKLFLEEGQEAKDVMFSLAGQKCLVFCYRQGHPATGAIFACVCIQCNLYHLF